MAFEKFHWTSPAGVEITLPHMKSIKAGVLRRHRKEDPVDFIFSLLEETSDAEMLAAVDSLDFADLEDLTAKWQSGVSLGESSGSST
ncbi:hypothetical protein [Arthrobacter sp. Alg241-R88]|uniref:hypothetical protein n=1 Tax=Arthrobacter sp. Alg241-R88 TaxID=2305984 RepID=UPI0013D099E4|nr:hypothetical protein [Arthrobacter sp. Alg241-R88]